MDTVIYPTFALLFGVLAIVTNGLSCFVLYRNLALTFGSPIIYYFITLNSVYFFKGIVAVCWSLSALTRSHDEEHLYKIGRNAFWTTALSLFLLLLGMAAERYINTCCLKRLQWLQARKKVYTYFCLAIVVFSLICGLLVALENTGYYVEFLICVIAEIVYISTLLITSRVWLKQRAQREDTTNQEAITHITGNLKTQKDCHRRLNSILYCYVIATLITVLPFFVAFQTKLVRHLFYKDSEGDNHLSKLLEVYPMLTCLSYGLSPMVYVIVLPKFRKNVKLLLTCRYYSSEAGADVPLHDSEETTSSGDFV